MKEIFSSLEFFFSSSSFFFLDDGAPSKRTKPRFFVITPSLQERERESV